MESLSIALQSPIRTFPAKNTKVQIAGQALDRVVGGIIQRNVLGLSGIDGVADPFSLSSPVMM